jgi:hypothetical protein
MTTMCILQLCQLLFALSGLIACIIWFFFEKRRGRQAPFMMGAWCFLLSIFRISRFIVISPLSANEIIIYNSLSNTLFLLGGAMITFLAINSIRGGKK